jgi:hypothetical protein
VALVIRHGLMIKASMGIWEAESKAQINTRELRVSGITRLRIRPRPRHFRIGLRRRNYLRRQHHKQSSGGKAFSLLRAHCCPTPMRVPIGYLMVLITPLGGG